MPNSNVHCYRLCLSRKERKKDEGEQFCVLSCMFESHSMSNLEPIIASIIYLENDTLGHINLATVISRQKLSLSFGPNLEMQLERHKRYIF